MCVYGGICVPADTLQRPTGCRFPYYQARASSRLSFRVRWKGGGYILPPVVRFTNTGCLRVLFLQVGNGVFERSGLDILGNAGAV